MICYKDKTFCPYWATCMNGFNCDRALTDKIKEDAIKQEMLISQFAEQPECYQEII